MVADLRANLLQMKDDIAEEPTSVKRAGARAQGTRAAALHREPHGLTATSDGPSVSATPSHRQTSAATREGTAGHQARREVRWRAPIGDCCAYATGLQKGATDWPWQ